MSSITKRVFERVLEQYTSRMEKYYKDDVLLKPEDIFKEEELSVVVPRTVKIGSDRQWLNTLNLLRMVSDFSIAGSLTLWRLAMGRVKDHEVLEPKLERTTAQYFHKGAATDRAGRPGRRGKEDDG